MYLYSEEQIEQALLAVDKRIIDRSTPGMTAETSENFHRCELWDQVRRALHQMTPVRVTHEKDE